MTVKKTLRVAVTGAAGQIGYSLLFRIASGEVFGPETEIELHLIEIEPAMKALNGVAMELNDCAFPLLKKICTTSDLNIGMDGVDYALLVGAIPRKAGMERGDLLKINGGIFGPQGKAINNKASSQIKVLVVGNPCNTNCYIAAKNAPDVPRDRFFAMTMLDENRAKYQLAAKLNVPIREIKNMIIWGNHSATQYPDFFHATVAGKQAAKMLDDLPWIENHFIPTVQKRGAEIIQARGLSSAASAANAIIDSLRALSRNTAHGDSFSMALVSGGQYEVDAGLVFSFPCRMDDGKLSVVENIVHSPFSKEKIKASLEELRIEAKIVQEMGLF